MSRRSQIIPTVIIYLLAVVIVGALIILAINSMNKLNETEQKVQMESFVATFESVLRHQNEKGRGSTEIISLGVPSDIETICFTDDSVRFSPSKLIDLTKEKEIYKDENIFFFPKEKYSPAKIDYIKLNESENPLCLNVENNKLNLMLTTFTNEVLVQPANEKDSVKGCTIVSGSEVGDSLNKIDIVFLGFGYKGKSNFANEVLLYTNNYLFQVEPFSANKDKFNIWMTDTNEPDCTISSYVFCDSLSVNKLASDCPNDFVFILVDKGALKTSVRSSSISNMVKINTRDNRLVLIHEFGHAFSNLADEYTDKYYKSWFEAEDYPNCDSYKCPSWSDDLNLDCIQGCSTNEFYRSIDVSIMKNYDKSTEFGPLNEKIIKENLGEYK